MCVRGGGGEGGGGGGGEGGVRTSSLPASDAVRAATVWLCSSGGARMEEKDAEAQSSGGRKRKVERWMGERRRRGRRGARWE